ncbi:MAG: NifU family protein [Alphaproteobacteria bacterium]|nr:NifU family protein [Rickettsiales bacterium]
MYIKVDKTPNENVLKFSIGQNFLIEGEFSQNSIFSNNINDKLPREILSINGVQSILICKNFISVSKIKDTPWGEMKPKILSIIVDILDIINFKEESNETEQNDYEPVNQLEKEVLSAINQRVRPAIQSHGGDVKFFGIENNVVKVKLMGACIGCSSSIVTLKDGIERMLMSFFPSITSVKEI